MVALAWTTSTRLEVHYLPWHSMVDGKVLLLAVEFASTVGAIAI